MKKSGFTLIELLAVIAILAIILVISIPRILDVIETSKINALKNAAQLIADSAEKKYAENEAFGEENEITCDSVSKLNKEDYCKCSIVFDENEIAKVSILGRGKFKGLKVIEATKTNAEVIKLEVPKYGITAVEYINGLYEYYGDSYNLKIDNTKDQNVRYYGSDPNNYVSFNNELWRIIGVFGNNVKLVRKDILGKLSWDSSESGVNYGQGINQWGESTYEDGTPYEGADLMQYLNKMYYGGETVTCYGGQSNATKACPTETLNDDSKSLIDNHTWNTGAPNRDTLYDSTTEAYDTLKFYQAERSNVNGKNCTSGNGCNDTVNRTTTWTGYIGLSYITDYAYASSESDCETKIDKSSTYKCKNNNWMQRDDFTWYLSPLAKSECTPGVWCVPNAHDAWVVTSDGTAGNGLGYSSTAFAPAIYLKSNILIESGNGSESNPYTLTIS